MKPVDEVQLAHSLAVYMGRTIHPLVAYILAYEDATASGQGNCWRQRSYGRFATVTS